MPFLLLSLSIILSTGRNIFSKKISDVRFGTKSFFLYQGFLFLSGAAALILFGKIQLTEIAISTVIYAIIYALLLIFAQWFYTAALADGNTGVCSTVYSMGFIFPTLSGAILWSESFSVIDAIGVLCAVSAVTVSGLRHGTHARSENSYYFIPLTIAMLSSGGLGIVQKLQQKSEYADEKSIFLFIAFMLAASISFTVALCTNRHPSDTLPKKKLAIASSVGVFFGCCNLLNTSLAGQLPSAVFFPTLNIGVIFLSMLCGIILFKEKISKKEIAVLILGVISIVLLNIG